MNNDQKRRASRPEVSGISAIFNPRKLRRNSTAVSSLLGANRPRTPSVIVTDDDNIDEVLASFSNNNYNPNRRQSSGGGPCYSGGLAPYDMTNGPGGGDMGGTSGAGQASSVPLLADVQSQMGQSFGDNTTYLQSSSTAYQQSSSNSSAQPGSGGNNNSNANLKPIAKTISNIRKALFSKTARKLCCGLFLSLLVGLCWTMIIHSIKRAYMTMHLFPVDSTHPMIDSNEIMNPPPTSFIFSAFDTSKLFHTFDQVEESGSKDDSNKNQFLDPTSQIVRAKLNDSHRIANRNEKPTNPNNHMEGLSAQHGGAEIHPHSSVHSPKSMTMMKVYDAPFFTAWMLTVCTILFYPIHQLTVRFCSCMGRKGPKSMSRAVSDAIQGFRDRGMTLFQFIGRCSALCFLWLLTNWLIVYSLKSLKPTVVLALFATTTSFVYLLSWVVLHQQFVGLRILAVILSNIGISLFAYMDGQTYQSKTITGVVLGATAAGTSAVFKVSLKKSFGFGATISQQVALIFSVVGIISMLVLWPIFVTLYFTGIEIIVWSYVPWGLILVAVFAFLLVSMLDNFGVTCTFEFFITIGLLMSIPFSAVLDVYLYKTEFDGMCLAGVIVVAIGFLVVLLPENWAEYITRLIRYVAQIKNRSRWGKSKNTNQHQEQVDLRTGHIRSHLRSPSGRVR